MNNHSVRIIGGRFRGRKIAFADAEGLRPTPDRVKETLFNWLMYSIHDATCLDLFAGSGALGLEAVSRGAQHVTLIEQQRPVFQRLQQMLQTLPIAEQTQLIHADSLHWLAHTPPRAFDIVFVDPPFQAQLWLPCLALLKTRGFVHRDSKVYVEYSEGFDEAQLAADWQVLKHKQMGAVRVALLSPII